MSNDELKSMPPVQGYINWQEMIDALLKGFGQPTLVALVVFIITSLAESADKWYTGPQAQTVIAILTMIAAFLRTRNLAKKSLMTGEPPL